VDCPNEQTLAAYASGRLAAAEAGAVESHARGCTTCPRRIAQAREVTSTVAHVAVARVRPRESSNPTSPTPDVDTVPDRGGEELARGTSIGRYTLLGLVGRGGMGEVYAAYDPELDRKIALKLMHARGSDAHARARLLREAKAIAKLSHVNVVVVHDAGTFGERVFIAMEFVDGQTLKQWLLERPRPRREILDVFARAGRGLAAAHAAGLVHRDFKPHNVMVSKDGDVRVMDFGVAREVDAEPEAPEGRSGGASGADVLPLLPASENDLTFTRTGELVGTPLYMAPEQFMAARTDARTDQFSFCVALYQALYGAHPFAAGGSIDALVSRVLAGEVQPPPPKHDVPAWLRRVLLRGVAVSPAARWPSMAALLDALERDPARAWRRAAAVASLALLVGAAAFTLVRGPRRAESLCRGGPARLAGVWETAGPAGAPDASRDAVERALVAAGGADARGTWTRVAAGLDRYAGAWLGMYRDACEATHVRGEQSPETLDLRMTCLDERRSSLGALTGVLAHADAVAVSKAVAAVAALPPVEPCGDVKLLREPLDTPRDEATRARADDIRRRLAHARVLQDTGRHEEALASVRALVAEARALGYRSLIAETVEAEGGFQGGVYFLPDSVRLLEEATWTALAVKRDDVAASASSGLAAEVGYYQGHAEEGWRWARLAQSLLDRMGPGHDLLRAWLLHNEANLKLVENDVPGALALMRQALALKEKILPPDHPDIAVSTSAVAEFLHRLGKNAEALAMVERARDTTARALGPNASELGHLASNEGEYLVALGRAKEAIPVFEDAVKRLQGTGPESPILAYPLTGLGQAYLALGRPVDARPVLEHAWRLRETVDIPVDAAETRFALARALWDTGGDRARARGLAVAARDAYAHASDAEHARGVDTWLATHAPSHG
jgi:tetratricopeptide (TPR) repeat protein